MKKTIVFLLVLFSAMLVQAQEDSLRANRYVMRSMLFGAGYTNVLDTYLSPLEYKGCEIRILRESMRMTRLMDGNVSSLRTFYKHIPHIRRIPPVHLIFIREC